MVDGSGLGHFRLFLGAAGAARLGCSGLYIRRAGGLHNAGRPRPPPGRAETSTQRRRPLAGAHAQRGLLADRDPSPNAHVSTPPPPAQRPEVGLAEAAGPRTAHRTPVTFFLAAAKLRLEGPTLPPTPGSQPLPVAYPSDACSPHPRGVVPGAGAVTKAAVSTEDLKLVARAHWRPVPTSKAVLPPRPPRPAPSPPLIGAEAAAPPPSPAPRRRRECLFAAAAAAAGARSQRRERD